jgi:hypothetical protein
MTALRLMINPKGESDIKGQQMLRFNVTCKGKIFLYKFQQVRQRYKKKEELESGSTEWSQEAGLSVHKN